MVVCLGKEWAGWVERQRNPTSVTTPMREYEGGGGNVGFRDPQPDLRTPFNPTYEVSSWGLSSINCLSLFFVPRGGLSSNKCLSPCFLGLAVAQPDLRTGILAGP